MKHYNYMKAKKANRLFYIVINTGMCNSSEIILNFLNFLFVDINGLMGKI